MKKVLIGIVAVLVLLFGGLTIFVNTKSDLIIEKVSEILEKNLNAKLEMKKLPQISVFPSLKVSVDKASLTAPDYTVTFNSADVNVSLMKLLSGTVQINSVKLDTLALKYIAAAKAANTPKQEKANAAPKEEASSIEDMMALVPAEISIINSNIFYKDTAQEVKLENINAEIEDFGINKNSSINLNGSFAYKDKTQDLAFNLSTAVNFLFMGQHIEYDIKNFKFTPTKGFPFTQPIDITAESVMDFSPLVIEKLNGTIKTPFAELNLKSKGDKQKGELTLDGDIFPLAIQKSFLADTSFNKLPEKMKVDANIANSAEEITINSFNLHPNNGLVSLKGVYLPAKQNLNATLYAENLAVQDYMPKSSNTKSNTKAAPVKSAGNAQKQTQGNSNFSFNLTADAKNISYEKFVLDAVHSVISGRITGKETIIDIKPLTLTKGNEPINLTAKLELAPKDLVSANIDIPQLTVKNWAAGLIANNPLDAQLTMHSNLSLKTADPLNTLNGSGQLDGKHITIETKLLPFITNLLSLNLKLEDFYEFNVLKAPFSIKNGLLSTTNTYVDSASILANTNGTTHLGKQTLNLHGNVELKKQHMVFPYKVGGTYSKPDIGLDLGKELQMLGKSLLNTGKAAEEGAKEGMSAGEKLIEKGLGKLFK